MLTDQLKEQLLEYSTKTNGTTQENKLNICAWVYDYALKNNEHSIDIIRYFLEEIGITYSDETQEPKLIYSSNDLSRLKKTYGKLVDSILETLLAKNLEEEDFYCELWNSILKTPALDSTESKVFALYYIWIDARIPYFHLSNGIDMSDQRFEEISNQLYKSITKARFILLTNVFNSRTERAKVLLDLLDSVDSIEKKTVLLAHIMTMLSISFNNTIHRLTNQNDETET